jgi:PAS domain S-box-containing protein
VGKIARVNEHVWTKYEVPEDMRGWFYALVNFASTYPLGMCITDMSRTGCPLVFINPAFLALTGYVNVEVLGRNCRFLQGEKTEQWPVAVMIDSLRRGVDCHVKITNYKKNGSTFSNLLTLRPVHDSNSVYRYSVGILVDLGSGLPSPDVVSKLDRLMRLMPDTVDVASPAVGPKHESKYADEELEQSVEQRITAAMSDKTKIYTSEILEDSDFYQRNYADHLEYIQTELHTLLSLDAPTFEPTPPSAKQAKTDNQSPLSRRRSFRSSASTRGE